MLPASSASHIYLHAAKQLPWPGRFSCTSSMLAAAIIVQDASLKLSFVSQHVLALDCQRIVTVTRIGQVIESS